MLTRIVDPDFFRSTVQKYPELENYPEALAYVSDPMLLLSVLSSSSQVIIFCPLLTIQNQTLWQDNPILLRVMKELMEEIIKKVCPI